MKGEFFDEQQAHSWGKSQVVVRYFPAWARIIGSTFKPQMLVYLDLFAGPGKFRDGSPSTPLLVARSVIANPALANLVQLVFNDGDKANAEALNAALEAIPDITSLRYEPRVYSEKVDEGLAVEFGKTRLHPTFAFIDPWGYKGLTRHLIRALLKTRGSECLFFFNDGAILRGLSNPLVDQPIAALFGTQRAEELRRRLKITPKREHEAAVVTALEAALHEVGATHVLRFVLPVHRGKRRLFHLVFVTNHAKGLKVMKEVMARLGVHRPSTTGKWDLAFLDPLQPSLFDDTSAVTALAEELAVSFASMTLPFAEVFENHQIQTAFTMADYRNAILQLEDAGRVVVSAPPGRRRSTRTLPPHMILSFPPREGE